jgi:hypothetical protein
MYGKAIALNGLLEEDERLQVREPDLSEEADRRVDR